MAFVRLPRLKVIAAGNQIEAAVLRGHAELDQLRYAELLVREHEPDLFVRVLVRICHAKPPREKPGSIKRAILSYGSRHFATECKREPAARRIARQKQGRDGAR